MSRFAALRCQRSEMRDGADASPKLRRLLKCTRQPRFGLLNRLFQSQPLGQARGDRGREGAARSVGVLRVDTRRGEMREVTVLCRENVDGTRAIQMPTFEQDTDAE